MGEITTELKKDLWRLFGSENNPCEWDGNIYGGGKLSQRYWEYFQTIEYLDLNKDSVLLDIGGGSNKTKHSFFASLVSKYIKEVHILDPNIDYTDEGSDNIKYLKEPATYDKMKSVLEGSDYTHISCVSVFEHIPDDIRNGIIRAIDEHFSGGRFVATLEYHPRKRFFEYQLTSRTLSNLFSGFSNFYLEDYKNSPVLCENAFKQFHRYLFPRWYPVAFNFLKV